MKTQPAIPQPAKKPRLDPATNWPFDDGLSACDECGARVRTIIGCPDGTEICQACFDAGAH